MLSVTKNSDKITMVYFLFLNRQNLTFYFNKEGTLTLSYSSSQRINTYWNVHVCICTSVFVFVEYVLKYDIAFLQVNGSLEVPIYLDNYSQTLGERYLFSTVWLCLGDLRSKYLLRKETKSH